jgi:hypothetical protein
MDSGSNLRAIVCFGLFHVFCKPAFFSSRNVKEFVDWLTRRNSLAAIARCGASIRLTVRPTERRIRAAQV